MKLILKENVPGLGYKDDIVEVKDGYGRNFLIPTGKAIIASKGAVKQLEEEQRQRAHKIAQLRAEAEDFCKTLEGTHLTIGAKASATGTIFGSVTPIQIADALEKIGHIVDRKIISINSAVKELGSYTAVIKPHKEVEVEITFDVVAE